jgi:hypothetical protein
MLLARDVEDEVRRGLASLDRAAGGVDREEDGANLRLVRRVEDHRAERLARGALRLRDAVDLIGAPREDASDRDDRHALVDAVSDVRALGLHLERVGGLERANALVSGVGDLRDLDRRETVAARVSHHHAVELT